MKRGRTVRDALAIALENLSGNGAGFKRGVLGDYLLGWIKDYALARGVVLSDDDVRDEISEAITSLRKDAPS